MIGFFMSEYARTRRDTEGEESYFCRFTFGQFFALLVLEVFTLFFIFYLGARYGREFLGLDRSTPNVVVGATTTSQGGKVVTTEDPEAQALANDLMAKAQTPELKERIAEMLKKDGMATPPATAIPTTATTVPPPTPESPSITVSTRVNEQVPSQLASTEEPTAAALAQIPPTQEPAKEQSMPMRAPNETDQSNTSMIRIKSADNARYSIQIGSYPNLAEANGIVSQWKGKGYPAYMMIADIPDRGRCKASACPQASIGKNVTGVHVCSGTGTGTGTT